MAKRLKLALAIVAGLAVGAGSAAWSMKRGGLSGAGAGGWYGNSVTGSVDADPWTRARVALTGLLALNKSQAIYFTTNVDAAGARLREDCRYQVAGAALPAQWWSVTVYADDDYLPLNDDDALSFDATEVKPDAAGKWTALVAPKPAGEGAWASSRKAGEYSLTLRLYQPARSAQDDFAAIPLPTVTRLDCGGAA
ncbi:DUF1214 domain-containing protein [Novosphingobium sp.]|uniref:DUF1214 domain-containing protein n=1 Tax=Novosphingobium sp. TaxID=1874826 RepID=UPI0027324CAB|nr:DUF1214 domain-containing protein [Novosphingobium sp.]MDP3907090.1 DUF1214 domain-containing protein [Novosphingobium sp.]